MDKLEKTIRCVVKGKNAVDYNPKFFRKLKKCPICGGKAELYYTREDKWNTDEVYGSLYNTKEEYKLYTVHCLNCGAECNKSGLTKREAVKEWNKIKRV